MRATITAHIPTRNCPNLFLACVSRLLWVDEIVVADNSDNDDVKEVSEQIAHPNIKYYATTEPDIRQRLVDLRDEMTSDYVLWVHTDELYSKEAAVEIINILKERNELCEGYIVPSVSYIYGELFGKGADQMRLVRRESFFFKMKNMHEMPEVTGATSLLKNGYDHVNSPRIPGQAHKVFLYSSNDAKKLSDSDLQALRLDTVSTFKLKKVYLIFILRMLYRSRKFLFARKLSFVYLWLFYLDIMNFIAKGTMPTEEIRIREGKIPRSDEGYF